MSLKVLDFFRSKKGGNPSFSSSSTGFPKALWIGEHARPGDKREAREGEGGGVMGTSIEPASPKSDRERLGTRQRLS